MADQTPHWATQLDELRRELRQKADRGIQLSTTQRSNLEALERIEQEENDAALEHLGRSTEEDDALTAQELSNALSNLAKKRKPGQKGSDPVAGEMESILRESLGRKDPTTAHMEDILRQSMTPKKKTRTGLREGGKGLPDEGISLEAADRQSLADHYLQGGMAPKGAVPWATPKSPFKNDPDEDTTPAFKVEKRRTTHGMTEEEEAAFDAQTKAQDDLYANSYDAEGNYTPPAPPQQDLWKYPGLGLPIPLSEGVEKSPFKDHDPQDYLGAPIPVVGSFAEKGPFKRPDGLDAKGEKALFEAMEQDDLYGINGTSQPPNKPPGGSGGKTTASGDSRGGDRWALEVTQLKVLEAIKTSAGVGSGKKKGQGTGQDTDEDKEPFYDKTDKLLSIGKRFLPSMMPGGSGGFLGRTVSKGISAIQSGRRLNKLLGGAKKKKLPVAMPVSKGPIVAGARVAQVSGVAAKGAGAAATGGGGAGAAGGTALAAAGGPVGIAIGAVVALGVVALEAGKAVYAFAKAQEDTIRKLGEVGPVQAAAVAKLDAERTFRDIKTAQQTGGSSDDLIKALDKFESYLQPIESLLTNLANNVGTQMLNTLTGLLVIMEPLVNVLTLIYNNLPGVKKIETPQTTWDFLKNIEEDQRLNNIPKWPQGPVGNTNPAPVGGAGRNAFGGAGRLP